MHPPRLSRLDRIYTDQIFYFLTFCTHERKHILANSTLHESFRQFAFGAVSRNIFVGRYVIMPDHIHLFAAFLDQTQLSPWIKALKGTLSKSLRATHNIGTHGKRVTSIIFYAMQNLTAPNGITSSKTPSATLWLQIHLRGPSKAR